MKEMMTLLMKMGVVERYVLIGSIIVILGLIIVIAFVVSRRKLYNEFMIDANYEDTVSKKYKKKEDTAIGIRRICLTAISAISIIVIRLLPDGDIKFEIAIIIIGVIVEIMCRL